jgi:hypothetical protein
MWRLLPCDEGEVRRQSPGEREGERIGVPKEIRTPVAAVKGQCPRPLDDGDVVGPGILTEA